MECGGTHNLSLIGFRYFIVFVFVFYFFCSMIYLPLLLMGMVNHITHRISSLYGGAGGCNEGFKGLEFGSFIRFFCLQGWYFIFELPPMFVFSTGSLTPATVNYFFVTVVMFSILSLVFRLALFFSLSLYRDLGTCGIAG